MKKKLCSSSIKEQKNLKVIKVTGRGFLGLSFKTQAFLIELDSWYLSLACVYMLVGVFTLKLFYYLHISQV